MCARHDVVAPAPTVYAPTCTPDAHPPGIVPKRRPPRPQQPIFGMFRRGGLRFGHIISRSRSPRRGKWRHENTDMPKERSSCCKTPPPAWRAPGAGEPDRSAREQRQGAAIARQLAQGLHQSTTQLAQQQPHRAPWVQNSPCSPALAAYPVQNSPSTSRTAYFRYKTRPAHPPSPHVRYKTLPAHPK